MLKELFFVLVQEQNIVLFYRVHTPPTLQSSGLGSGHCFMCLTDVTERPERAQGDSAPGDRAGQGSLFPYSHGPNTELFSYAGTQ